MRLAEKFASRKNCSPAQRPLRAVKSSGLSALAPKATTFQQAFRLLPPLPSKITSARVYDVRRLFRCKLQIEPFRVLA